VVNHDVPPEHAPHRVRLPVNVQHWDNIAFLHWPIAADAIAGQLPEQLTPHTHDGTAWVSVTPFRIRVRPPGIPVSAAFPETNVRTYVKDADGRDGLWFLHMEVTASWFVAALRSLGLPYVRQKMTVQRRDARFVYWSRPGAATRAGGHDITVLPGEPIPRPTPRDIFLTARWGAYHRRGPAVMYTPVDHAPWPLHKAWADTHDVAGLFSAAGLPGPTDGPALVHFSPGVKVKVGLPKLV
jgi:uncharacterized protein